MVQLATYPVPEEGIKHVEENVQATIESSNLGTGKLYITESEVVWLNSSGEGIKLQYRLISLHAISRDIQSFPKEHLLLHHDGNIQNLDKDSDADSGNDDNEDGDSVSGPTEVRFAPQQTASLDDMFAALSYCQTLHPDDDCQLSDDDFQDADENAGMYQDINGGGFFQDESGLNHLNEEGLANLERFNQMLVNGSNGQGDADLAAQTNQLTLVNGYHEENDENEQNGQFEDMDNN